MMISVIGSASRISTVVCIRILAMLAGVANTGLIAAKTTNRTTSTIATPGTRATSEGRDRVRIGSHCIPSRTILASVSSLRASSPAM